MRGRLLIGILAAVLVVSLISSVRADAPPHVTIVLPPGGSTVSGTVEIAGHAWDDVQVVLVKVHIDAGEWWNATDVSGNDTWWKWSTSWDTTLVDDGWHHVGALAKDSAGQLGDTAIEVYVQNHPTGENHPPWAHIESPPGGSTVSGVVTVTGTSGDPDANDTVEMVQVRIDLGEWANATATGDNGSFAHWSYAWDTTLFADGWHAVRARAFDGTVWGEAAVKEYYVDNVQGEPWVEIVDPKAGQTVSGTILVHGVAGADGNATVELVQVRIGDGAWHDATDTSHNGSWGTWAWQWDTTQTPNGERSVCARSWDGSLYSAENCRNVKVANENHRPGVKILHPYNGQTVSGLFLIHGTAWDDVGVELVQVEFNDGGWLDATDTSPDASWATWAYEWNTKDRDDGCLHLSARSWDGTLYSETATIYVCVDNVNEAPWVHITDPDENETVSGLYLIHGTAGDDHQVKLVQVRIDGGEWREADNTGHERPWSTWAREWNTKEWDNGNHTVCARAWDGTQYGDTACVHVIVHNEDGGGAPREPTDAALPILAIGGAGALGVAILMWLRAHGHLGK